MANRKRMTTFFLVLIFFGAIIAAVGGLGYNYYKDKSGSQKHSEIIEKQNYLGEKIDTSKKSISDELTKKHQETDSLISDKVNSSKDEIITKQENAQTSIRKDIKEGVNKIADKLDKLQNPPKDPNGLYRFDKKWGSVENFKLNSDETSFTIDKISFDNPLKSTDDIWEQFQYKHFLLKFEKVEDLVMMYPPMAAGIKGVIIKRSKKKN